MRIRTRSWIRFDSVVTKQDSLKVTDTDTDSIRSRTYWMINTRYDNDTHTTTINTNIININITKSDRKIKIGMETETIILQNDRTVVFNLIRRIVLIILLLILTKKECVFSYSNIISYHCMYHYYYVLLLLCLITYYYYYYYFIQVCLPWIKSTRTSVSLSSSMMRPRPLSGVDKTVLRLLLSGILDRVAIQRPPTTTSSDGSSTVCSTMTTSSIRKLIGSSYLSKLLPACQK